MKPLGPLLLLLLAACTATSRERRTSVLEYLYPEGKPASPAQDVHLDLPLSVGLAFVPPAAGAFDRALAPTEEEALLGRVRDAFADVEGIDRIELVPRSFLVPHGGFENVDRIRQALGVDLVALVSFEQVQFDDPNLASITYWTVLGAYVVPGERNETHTLVEATVFDVVSRALLLNASGSSVVEGHATAVDLERSLREDSYEGFDLAVDDLITNLGTSLAAFREQVRSGTVRGRGTPAVDVSVRGQPAGQGGTGVGGIGLLELGLGALALAVTARRGGGR